MIISIKKTNAIRELEKAKIKFIIKEYEVDEKDLSAINVALKTGAYIEQVFKTLVLFNEKKELIVACIQGDAELDLKKLSKLSNSKKVEMLGVKELLENTGYIRGGCSPVGIKKKHLTYINESALKYEEIYISGGAKGIQVLVNPKELIKYLNMVVSDIVI